jgi:hypothetical protein
MGKKDQFNDILKEATSDQAEDHYKGDEFKHQRIAVINALAAQHIERARGHRDTTARNQYILILFMSYH